jgi:hypothetical protein
MGTIPATGSEISLGRLGAALGVVANATTQISLNAQAGTGRNRATSGTSVAVAGIASGSATQESTSFGGLTSPNVY